MKTDKIYIVHAHGQDFEFTSKAAVRHYADEVHGDPTLYRTIERTREPKWNELTETPKPEAGLRLWVDSWENYSPCVLEESDWERADFYTKTPNTKTTVALRLEVTGRTFQRPFGFDSPECVRVRVEFVGDGENSTYAKGWLELKEAK